MFLFGLHQSLVCFFFTFGLLMKQMILLQILPGNFFGINVCQIMSSFFQLSSNRTFVVNLRYCHCSYHLNQNQLNWVYCFLFLRWWIMLTFGSLFCGSLLNWTMMDHKCNCFMIINNGCILNPSTQQIVIDNRRIMRWFQKKDCHFYNN